MNLRDCEKYLDGRNAKQIKVFVYYEYNHPERPGIRTDEMNLWEWMRIQRMDISRYYTFKRLIDLSETSRGQEISTQADSEILPIIEDEYECPLCGMSAESEESLKRHKQLIHDNTAKPNDISYSGKGSGKEKRGTSAGRKRKKEVVRGKSVRSRKPSRRSKKGG